MFDIIQDAPGLLRAESLQVVLHYEQLSPDTGRVSWNIPTPAAGCDASNQSYCGMVIVASDTPPTTHTIPTDGIVYNSDPTIDTQLFAGDQIGKSMVVGAVYRDRSTNFIDISGTPPNSLYISGYPVDCQGNYFRPGVHAFSQSGKFEVADGTAGYQIVQMNPPDGPGVEGQDPTGLTSGIKYSFDIQVGLDPVVPIGTRLDRLKCFNGDKAQMFTIEIDGSYAQNYDELVNQINIQFAKLHDVTQSEKPPRYGTLYWDKLANQLYLWDGYRLVPATVTISERDPSIVDEGLYWFDGEHLRLRQNDLWETISNTYTSVVDPLDVLQGQIWFNGDLNNPAAAKWNGVAWCDRVIIVSNLESVETPFVDATVYWFSESETALYHWNSSTGDWRLINNIIQSSTDPINATSYIWYDGEDRKEWTGTDWTSIKNITVNSTDAQTLESGEVKYWYNPESDQLYVKESIDGELQWIEIEVVEFDTAPNDRKSCDLWWNLSTDEIHVWDFIKHQWNKSTFYAQHNDPSQLSIDPETLVYDPELEIMYEWDGECFKEVQYFINDTVDVSDGIIWIKPDGTFWIKVDNQWIALDVLISKEDPTQLPAGYKWIHPTTEILKVWNGLTWIELMYTTTDPTPSIGEYWLSISPSQLHEWNGSTWIATDPRLRASVDCNGNLLFEDTTTGNNSYIWIDPDNDDLFKHLDDSYRIRDAVGGSDAPSDVPSYKEEGVGTDGNDALRNELANDIRYDLGYPVVDVELTAAQLDMCVDKALEEIRQRSGGAYKRSFYMISISPNVQKYSLTDKSLKHNKIVEVTGVYRVTSAFLSSAHGAGIYGQIVLQQLYSMGTYDLTSHFLMSNYVSLMEQLFASRVSFHWDERSRELWLHNRFPYKERNVLLDAVVERTEQEIITDRYLRPLVRKMATSFARLQLAEIRGKYSQLPSASGGVSLNATDLRAQAERDLQACIDDIENFVGDRPEEYGRHDFTWG